MKESFKGPTLGVHRHREKFSTGIGQGFQSDFLSVSGKASIKKPVSTQSKSWKQEMQIATVIP